jgi:hypothetical protein
MFLRIQFYMHLRVLALVFSRKVKIVVSYYIRSYRSHEEMSYDKKNGTWSFVYISTKQAPSFIERLHNKLSLTWG